MLRVRTRAAPGALTYSTDRPLRDIAETVGNGSDISFSRAYKRRFGVPPSYGRSDLGSPYSP